MSGHRSVTDRLPSTMTQPAAGGGWDMPQWVSPKRIDRANCTNPYGRTCPALIQARAPNSGIAATDRPTGTQAWLELSPAILPGWRRVDRIRP